MTKFFYKSVPYLLLFSLGSIFSYVGIAIFNETMRYPKWDYHSQYIYILLSEIFFLIMLKIYYKN